MLLESKLSANEAGFIFIFLQYKEVCMTECVCVWVAVRHVSLIGIYGRLSALIEHSKLLVVNCTCASICCC